MDIQLSSGEIFRQFPSDVAHAFCALGLAKPLTVAREEAAAQQPIVEPLPSAPAYSVVWSKMLERWTIVLKKPNGEVSTFDGYGITTDRQVMEGLARTRSSIWAGMLTRRRAFRKVSIRRPIS